MSLKRILFYLFSFIFILFQNGWSQQSEKQIRQDELVIKLVIIDPGDELTMWWGHTAIIVENTRTGQGRFYNYGLFSFQQENFFVNFAMGRLIFWVGASDAKEALFYYRSINRTIRIQVLNLTPEKKKKMAGFLENNILPENSYYLYEHYTDNCATRVRDLIDEIADGELAKLTKVPGRFTFREHTRRHTHRDFFMDWLLMFLMNDSIDKPIQQWDEMFLPTELEKNVARLTYTGEGGKIIPFIERSYLYFEAKNVYIVPEEPPLHTVQTFILSLAVTVSIVIGAVFLYFRKPAGKYIFAVYNIFFGIILGIPGTALFFMGLFTNHTVTFHNENLFLANPLSLFAILTGFGILKQKIKLVKWGSFIWYLMTFSSWILLVLKIFSVFDQQNWESIHVLLPVNTAMAVSFFILLTSNKFEYR